MIASDNPHKYFVAFVGSFFRHNMLCWVYLRRAYKPFQIILAICNNIRLYRCIYGCVYIYVCRLRYISKYSNVMFNIAYRCRIFFLRILSNFFFVCGFCSSFLFVFVFFVFVFVFSHGTYSENI